MNRRARLEKANSTIMAEVLLILSILAVAMLLKTGLTHWTSLGYIDSSREDANPDVIVIEGASMHPLPGQVGVHVLNPSVTILSDYQIGVQLTGSIVTNWSTPPNTVYVTDQLGNPLYYWVEEWNSTTEKAMIWFKAPFIGAGAEDVFLIHYGGLNPYPSYNDPSQVFILFDDFTILNTTLWDDASLNNGSLTATGLRINVGSIVTRNALPIDLTQGYAVDVRAAYNNSYEGGYGGSVPSLSTNKYTDVTNADNQAMIVYARDVGSGATIMKLRAGDGGPGGFNIEPYKDLVPTLDGRFYVFTVALTPGSLSLGLDYSTIYLNASIHWVKPIHYIRLGFYTAYGYYDIKDTLYDWVRIRKHAWPPPRVEVFIPSLLTLYVRNIGKSEVTLDALYVTDPTGETLLLEASLGEFVLRPGEVKRVEVVIPNPQSPTVRIHVKTTTSAGDSVTVHIND